MAGRLLSDYFTAELQTPSGQVLPSIDYDGQRCFVCESGTEFVVSVAMVNYSKNDYRVGGVYTRQCGCPCSTASTC